MTIIKWVIVLFVAGMAIFFLWPVPEIVPKQVNFITEIPREKINKIVLVYNAKSDKVSVLKDFYIKEFMPSKYACNLCRITFGTFTMKREWKQFLDSLPIKKEFLHKDEFAKKYSLPTNDLPAIFSAAEDKIALLVTAEEINNVHTLPALQQLVKQKLVW